MEAHPPPRGQILVGATVLLMTLLILVPTMIHWVRSESHMSVKEQRNVTAFNLAEAAVDRALWKLKSSTSTWKSAVQGTALPGYTFSTVYDDIHGGLYRVKLSSGPGTQQVTVRGEGRDRTTGQVRALEVIFEDHSLPGPLLASGVLTYDGSFESHWGPVMAHNNINISGNAAPEYFPRKFSKQSVTGTSGQPRDTNGINPPNTDNVEWWSSYAVPDLPVLDFVTMRASAAASGTLNYKTNTGFDGAGKCTGWAGHNRCMSGGASAASHIVSPTSYHFFDSNDHPLSKNNLTWYWDPGIDVTLSGNTTAGCHAQGLVGMVVARGNLVLDAGDCYSYVGPVPSNAWKEYARIKTAQWDTATTNEYPADNGLQASRTTFNHGGESWTGGPPTANTDVGVQGFVYTGGDLTINSISDVAGTIWVSGNVTNNATGERVLVFYEGSNQNIPLLNVVLTRERWDEVPPDQTPWP